jgi:CYTH domain-containing protein
MTANQELELEYTFLASELPREIEGVSPKRLMDIYIPDTNTGHPRLRLRQKGTAYELTKKTPVNEGDASAQIEVTIQLDESEFAALSTVSQKRVVKDRYAVNINGFPAEVDVFRENLEGLVLIDFEFASEEERAKFIKPEVCLADVTQEDFIAGGLLAGKGYADIASDLDRFNYRALS